MVQDFVGHVLVPAHLVPIVTPQAFLKDSHTSRGQRYHLWLRTTTLEAKPSFVYLPPLDPGWARSHRSSLAECCQPLSAGGAIQATHFAFTLVTFSLLNSLSCQNHLELLLLMAGQLLWRPATDLPGHDHSQPLARSLLS